LKTPSKILGKQATKTAIYGGIIGLGTIVVATLSAAFVSSGEVSLDAIILAQKTNTALWTIDIMPFVFMFWGQRMSSSIAEEADTMVIEKTNELWNKTQQFRDQIEQEYSHDQLTKLPNAQQFLKHINQLLEPNSSEPMAEAESLLQTFSGYITKQHKVSRHMAIILLEIDHFKEISQTFGSQNADDLLLEASIRIKQVFAQSQTMVARIGVDNFGILVNKVAETQVVATIEKVHAAFKQPFEINGLTITLEISVGACLHPQHGDTAQELMQNAEIARYACQQDAKAYTFYSPALNTYNIEDLILKTEISRAFEHDELQLYYQPKLNARGDIHDVEALIRWLHPEKGLISPDTFIPMIIQKRMNGELLRRILHLALTQAKAWQAQDIHVRIALNLTAFDLLEASLPDMISDELREFSLTADSLKLEITETSLIENQELALITLNKLSEMGIPTSIDDFGTGYSSLSYLTSLPIDEIKIDQMFVKTMASNHKNQKIVQAIIALAHSLSLATVAEGVEDKETLQMLRKMQCDYIQGYYISKPLSAAHFTAWIQKFKAARSSAVQP